MTRIIETAIVAQRILAPWILILPVGLYFWSWSFDLYTYGFMVIGLAPLQIMTGTAGVLSRFSKSAPRKTAFLLNDIALIAAPIIATVYLKTISWT